MTTPPKPEPAPTVQEVEKAVEDIEKQEEKVEDAPTAAKQVEEQKTLDVLLARFDALTSRLNDIDKRLAEPTVPAPTAKVPETAVEAPKEPDGVEGTVSPEAGPPKKRRLGAWG
jgi:hypothetical protein